MYVRAYTFLNQMKDEIDKLGEIDVRDNKATLFREIRRNGELVVQVSQLDINEHPDRYEPWGTFKG
jgi:hypothetical protein